MKKLDLKIFRSDLRYYVRIVMLCIFVFFFLNTSKAQIPVDLSEFNKQSETQVSMDGNVLNISWMTDNENQGHLALDLQPRTPLIQSIKLDVGGNAVEIASNLDPTIILTVGNRDLDRNGWMVFFDNPPYKPHTTYSLSIDKKNAKVVSEGARTHVIIGDASAGPFSGKVNLTLYHGSPLMNIAAELSTQRDSTAIIYDAGFISKKTQWEKIVWADPEDYMRDIQITGREKSKNLAVKYRTIIGQSSKGSIAVFPPPHQYFYPLNNAFNEKHTWYGRNYRGEVDDFGIGIRHDLLGDSREYWKLLPVWFNAPPETKQDLNFFCLLSTEKDGKVLNEVKKYTHSDKYKPLEGYYTMSSHFHQEHTMDVLTHKQGAKAEKPDFVKAFRKMGVNIVHLGEFHLTGNPRGPDVLRLTELKALFEECARLSDGNFLLLPGEEPNNWFGGHWMNIFANPVYWIMSRDEDKSFVEDDPEYGKVYRIGSKEEMLKLMELEDGLAWTAHPRIKGSIGYPDKYKDEAFYLSDRFIGATWKPMPADLSHPELGERALDLMDDMANWGQHKYMLAEADLFKIRPSFELYGHLNVNYLQLDELPEFEDGWPSIIDAMQQGKFFSTTGEILLPEFNVNGKGAGETLSLSGNGDVTINIKANWTFPLKYIEIISGDGDQVYKEKIPLHETQSFGEKTFELTVNLKGRNWVRVEVWDVATNGTFTQFVWLE